MRKTLLLLVVLALSLASQTNAGPGGCTNDGSLAPINFEQITVSSTALGFTVAKFEPPGTKAADLAVVNVEAFAVRYRVDGLNPTASVGQPAAADTAMTVCGTLNIRAIRFIRQTSDATLSVHYYRMGDQ